jgi:GNAT superfamily N-acetyltransferase
MRKDDLPRLRAFLHGLALPDAEARAATIEWIFSSPTLAEGPGYLAAIENEAMRGYFGQVPVRLYAAGKPFVAVYHQNVLVDPALRGQGLATALLKAAEEYDLPQLGLWGNERVVSIIEKAGFRPVRTVRAFKKIFRFERVRSIPTLMARPLSALSSLAQVTRFAAAGTGALCVEPVTRFGSGHDELFRRVASSWELVGDRGSELLNWRYVDIPYREYHRLHAVRNGQVVGWLVCRLQGLPGGGASGIIADFLVDPADGAALGALLHAADRFFTAMGAAFAVCRTTHALTQRRLAWHGYIPMPARPTDSVRLKYPERMPAPASMLRGKRWFITLGDSDGDL